MEFIVIHPSGLFDYVGEFASTSFGDDEIVVPARSRGPSEEPVLVGHAPKVRFWRDRVVLIARDSNLASMKWMSFPVGDAVFLMAAAGDELRMVRTGSGELG